MRINVSNHPCFNFDAKHKYGRIHLPVAPKCNIKCNFCNRKYDCVNESRPGVTSRVLSPDQAFLYLEEALKIVPNISVVGIAGPGDSFANTEETIKTIELVREKYPNMLLCVATNALNIEPYFDKLSELEVTHVSVSISAVDPDIGSKIYSWIRHNKRVKRGRDGVSLLIEKQQNAIVELKKRGIIVKINTIIIPGINDEHIPSIAKRVAELGADILNCMPLYPVHDTPFSHIEEPSKKFVSMLSKRAEEFIPQMRHCVRCRADAVGILGKEPDARLINLINECADLPINPSEDRSYIAVTSNEGALINQHLGEAKELLIYSNGKSGIELIDRRKTPNPGSGDARWEELAQIMRDCHTLLVSGAGERPLRVLGSNGIKVCIMEGILEEAVGAIFENQNINYL